MGCKSRQSALGDHASQTKTETVGAMGDKLYQSKKIIKSAKSQELDPQEMLKGPEPRKSVMGG